MDKIELRFVGKEFNISCTIVFITAVGYEL